MPPKKGTGHSNDKKKGKKAKAQQATSVVWLMDKSDFSANELQKLTAQFKKLAADKVEKKKKAGKGKGKGKGKEKEKEAEAPPADAAAAAPAPEGGGENLISKEEFVQNFSTIMKVNTSAAEELFMAADDSGDGYIDYLEFISMMSSLFKGGVESKLEIIFDAYDTDDNRFISKKEMRSLLNNSITIDDEQQKQEEIESIITRAFTEMDVNGDGYISFPEAKNALKENPRLLQEYFGQNIVDCDELF